MGKKYILANAESKGVDFISADMMNWSRREIDDHDSIDRHLLQTQYPIAEISSEFVRMSTEFHIYNFFPREIKYNAYRNEIRGLLSELSNELTVSEVNNKILELRENESDAKITAIRRFAYLSSHLHGIRRNWRSHLETAKALGLFFEPSSISTGIEALETTRKDIETHLRDNRPEVVKINGKEHLRDIDCLSPMLTTVVLSPDCLNAIEKHNTAWMARYEDDHVMVSELLAIFNKSLPSVLRQAALNACYYNTSNLELREATKSALIEDFSQKFIAVSVKFKAELDTKSFYGNIANWILDNDLGIKRDPGDNIRKHKSVMQNTAAFQSAISKQRALAKSIWIEAKEFKTKVTMETSKAILNVLGQLIPDYESEDSYESSTSSSSQKKESAKTADFSVQNIDNNTYVQQRTR